MSERRIAVIGAGLGGLAAAMRLQAQGFDTTLYEARDAPGGRAYVYRDDGFVFDAGPTVSDPSLAPPDHECFYVLSPVPHRGQAEIDWDDLGPRYADRILASLESFLPDLRANLVTQRIFTPSDFERELAAYQGSAFSVAPALTQSAWFRSHNKDRRIPGLYLVGAGTHPGAGCRA